MEFFQLLKTLSDQSSQANMIDQVKLLNETVVALENKIFFTWLILFSMIVATLILIVYCVRKLEKRIINLESDFEKSTPAYKGE